MRQEHDELPDTACRRILEIRLSSPDESGNFVQTEQHPAVPLVIYDDEEVVVRNGLLKVRPCGSRKARRVLGSEDPDTFVVGVTIGYIQ